MVKSLKQIRKCLPQLLKLFISRCNSLCISIFLVLPETPVIFFPLNDLTASLRMIIEGPSGMLPDHKKSSHAVTGMISLSIRVCARLKEQLSQGVLSFNHFLL